MSYLDITPETQPKPKRLGMAIAIGAIVALLVIGAILLLAGGGSFEDLVEMTEEAEGAEVWITYFTAEDCLLRALTEDPGALEVSLERLESETAALAMHVDNSLVAFNTFGTRPWQDALRNAHEAIIAHYVVWEAHLTKTGPVLAAINFDPARIEDLVPQWLELSQAAVEPISSTFEEAAAAFEEAAQESGQTDLIDSLFVPADVSCTRTAV